MADEMRINLSIAEKVWKFIRDGGHILISLMILAWTASAYKANLEDHLNRIDEHLHTIDLHGDKQDQHMDVQDLHMRLQDQQMQWLINKTPHMKGDQTFPQYLPELGPKSGRTYYTPHTLTAQHETTTDAGLPAAVSNTWR